MLDYKKIKHMADILSSNRHSKTFTFRKMYWTYAAIGLDPTPAITLAVRKLSTIDIKEIK